MKSVQDAAGSPWESEVGGAAFRRARFLQRLAPVVAGLLLTALVASGQQYVISTFAGGGPPLSPAPALSISLGTVWGVANDPAGNAYLSSSDLNSVQSPFAVAIDGSGNLFVAELDGNRVDRISLSGEVTPVGGNAARGLSGDLGATTSAQLNALTGGSDFRAGRVR